MSDLDVQSRYVKGGGGGVLDAEKIMSMDNDSRSNQNVVTVVEIIVLGVC